MTNPETTIKDLLENGHAIIITLDNPGKIGWLVSKSLDGSPLPIAILEIAKAGYMARLTQPPPSKILKPVL